MSQKTKRIRRTFHLSEQEDKILREKAAELGWSVNSVVCQLARRADWLQVELKQFPPNTPTIYDLPN